MPCLPNEIITDLGCIPNTPAGFVQKFYDVGLGAIGGVGVLGMVYGCYLIITSQGNSNQVQKGKRYLTSSVLGILLVIFAVFFIKVVAVDMLHIPGFS